MRTDIIARSADREQIAFEREIHAEAVARGAVAGSDLLLQGPDRSGTRKDEGSSLPMVAAGAVAVRPDHDRLVACRHRVTEVIILSSGCVDQFLLFCPNPADLCEDVSRTLIGVRADIILRRADNQRV